MEMVSLAHFLCLLILWLPGGWITSSHTVSFKCVQSKSLRVWALIHNRFLQIAQNSSPSVPIPALADRKTYVTTMLHLHVNLMVSVFSRKGVSRNKSDFGDNMSPNIEDDNICSLIFLSLSSEYVFVKSD